MGWFEYRNIQEIDLIELIKKKEEGIIKLPLYQRNSIWSEGRICALWDSLLRGFPLPSFLLVKGKGISREFQSHLLDVHGESVQKNEVYYDLLDGQQRVVAIDSVFTYSPSSSVLRLWVDLAPNKEDNPFKFKYWIHACNKVFPFGFGLSTSGEHDFAVLTDHEITEIWNKLQEDVYLKGKEFYQLSLDRTCPYKASCPVPLDELTKLITQPHLKDEALEESIIQLSNKYQNNIKKFLKSPNEPRSEVVERVARGLERLRECTFLFQLIQLDKDEDEEITFFERIGRGGIQITQRQLAVSKLMLLLDKEGNDAISSFQRSEKLQHLLDTEDVIHGLARTALLKANKENSGSNEIPAQHDDLLELSPVRLKAIQKDKNIWGFFVENLKTYCQPSSEGQSIFQQAFERLYDNLRFKMQDNPNGFSLVQLTQPDKKHGGILPVTLHPLLFWYLVNPEEPLHENHRENMLRWILFSNGFVTETMHAKFNREVFRLVADKQKIDFNEIMKFVFSDEQKQLRKELGFTWEQPDIDQNGEIIQKENISDEIPGPKEVTRLAIRRLILQNWPSSRLNDFTLMWNQREAMEHFYGDIKFRPALFSKGRPFDADHIVARNRFLYHYANGITDESVKNSIIALMDGNDEIKSIIQLSPDNVRKSILLSGDCFRKHFPNMCANYRYWPKRLNRYDHDKPVIEKFKLAHVKNGIKDHPLNEKFNDTDSLWKWSAIPIEDREIWEQLPPNDTEDYTWSEELMGKFIYIIMKREYFLYRSAYNFITSKE